MKLIILSLLLFSSFTSFSQSKGQEDLNQALSYLEQGEFGKAGESANKAIKKDPNLADAYYVREMSRIQETPVLDIKDFDKAIELGTKIPEAYYHRALIHQENGNFEKALADYTKTIEMDPANWGAYGGRGSLYEEMEMYDKGIDDYTKALETGYSAPEFMYTGIAECKLALKDHEGALASINMAIETGDMVSYAYVVRAKIYLATGEKSKACTDFQRAKEEEFGDPGYIIKLIGENCK